MQLELTSHVAGTEVAVEETAGRMTSILQLSSPVWLQNTLQPTSNPCNLLTARGSLQELTFADQLSAA